MSPLSHPDNHHLEAAEGWLGLGDWQEASIELNEIQPSLQNHPSVLEVRYKIHAAAKQWDLALAVAQAVQQRLPDELWGHFYAAYAEHELKLTAAAYQTLKAVVMRYPKDYLIRYNLACYACQLGNLEEAQQWFQQAGALTDKRDLVKQACEDPDLKPLWARFRSAGQRQWW